MTIFGAEILHPGALALAVLAVPAAWFAQRAAGRVVFSSLDALPRGATLRTRLAWIPTVLLALAVVALCIALSGPRKGIGSTRIRKDGIAIAMVVDISSSMRALDLSDASGERTRLDAVKQVFRQFVLGGAGLRGRGDDAIGLVSFARYADTRSPLTLDHANLVRAASELELVTEEGEDGTAVGEGLALAVERLRDAPARSKVAIVLTDGVSNAGEIAPLAAADLARDAGVKVYTVGAGTNGMAPVRMPDPFTGGDRLVSVRVEIDEDTMRAIAERAGGRYFRATDAAGLREVYKEIDRLERTEMSEQARPRYRDHDEYYAWFVGAAMILIAVAMVLRGSWLRRLP
jgi:Ca-activated chloride channel family protein